ncbi:hypothetical protein JCM8547_008979 [Rhodosporidiobolus lusitaniae]
MTRPQIRVRAGPSLSQLQPLSVNSAPVSLSSSSWEGSVSVRLLHYPGPHGQREPKEGEELEEGGQTWSVSFEGRWKDEVGVDEVLFGNVWSKPIRDFLPYGTAAALRVVKYVDPSLTCDLYADKPWALSPLFATLQRLSIRPSPSPTEPLPPFEPKHGSFPDDVSPLLPSSVPQPANPAARRSLFAKEENRKAVEKLGPGYVVRGSFDQGWIDFDTLSLALPGGIKFSLAKYWTGEPLVFSCQRRPKKGEEAGEAETYFVVSFELVGEGVEKPKEGEGKEEEGGKESEDVD